MNTLTVELINICAWFEANHLSLTQRKLFCLIIPRRKPVGRDIASTFITGNVIKRANDAKFLGAVVDEKLSFRSHADYIVTKLSRYIYILDKMRHFNPSMN